MSDQVAPVRAEQSKSFKRLTSKQLLALRDRLAGLPDQHEPAPGAPEPDPALIYSKADPRWARIHDSLAAELDGRARSAAKSSQGAGGQGKVRGPRR